MHALCWNASNRSWTAACKSEFARGHYLTGKRRRTRQFVSDEACIRSKILGFWIYFFPRSAFLSTLRGTSWLKRHKLLSNGSTYAFENRCFQLRWMIYRQVNFKKIKFSEKTQTHGRKKKFYKIDLIGLSESIKDFIKKNYSFTYTLKQNHVH